MSVEADVLAAKTPREALLILARAIDALLAAPADPWAQWDDDAAHHAEARPSGPHPDEVDPPRREITDEEATAWLEANYGRTPADDAEGRALIAMVRRDLERAGKGEVAVDDFVMHDGIVESRIDFSPRDEKHRAAREAFARQVLQLDVALGVHPEGGDWAVDYAKAGPMPFYIANRDLLMQYPDQVKSAIVADIEQYDVRVSQEVGRDLLKAPMIKDENSPAGKINILADN